MSRPRLLGKNIERNGVVQGRLLAVGECGKNS